MSIAENRWVDKIGDFFFISLYISYVYDFWSLFRVKDLRLDFIVYNKYLKLFVKLVNVVPVYPSILSPYYFH